MRNHLPLLLLCMLLSGCPQGPDPAGPDEPPRQAVTPSELEPLTPTAAESRLRLASRLETGTRRSRYSKIEMNYRITRSEIQGFAGREYERSKEESFSAEVLRPGSIRRHYQMSTNKVVALQGGKQLGREVGQTDLHGKRVTLQLGDGGLEVWDESGPLGQEATETMVFDLISLGPLSPPGEVQLGQRWQTPVSALPHILGATEPGRTLSGTIDCQLVRLVALGGIRAAEIRLTVNVKMVDRKVVQDKIEYRMTTQLTLTGDYHLALAEQRPLKLTLAGRAVLDHEPLRVDFIPPGTEALTKPFHAEGTMKILLRFP